MRHWWWRSAIGPPAIVVLFACAESSRPSPGEWAGTVDTLSSGRLVVHNPDAPLWERGEEWQLRERFRVGRAEGEGPDLFGDVTDIELGADGDLYVLDGQAAEIRVFDDGGEHRLTFARAGEGPGELSRPAGMALDPDSILWVMNWGNGRFSGFDPGTGTLVGEVRRLASFAAIPWPGRFDRAGGLLDVGLAADGEPAILGLDTAFVPHDTLRMPRRDERHEIYFRRGDLVVMSMLEPFAPQPTWAPHPNGGIVVGEGDSFRLHHIDFDADTTMTIEVRRAPVPVTRDERDSALAVFRESSALAGDAVPDRQPEPAENKPAHGAIFVDDDRRIWVRRSDLRAWDVFGEDGRLLGAIAIPLALSYVPPAVRGDRLAIVTAVGDVPTIVVYDIVRPDEEASPATTS